jgi:hypothetical protein
MIDVSVSVVEHIEADEGRRGEAGMQKSWWDRGSRVSKRKKLVR